MNVHNLKTASEGFSAIWEGKKSFELRFDDRKFAVNDMLVLHEYDGKHYLGRKITASINYLLHGPAFGLQPGWAIMSIFVVQRISAQGGLYYGRENNTTTHRIE